MKSKTPKVATLLTVIRLLQAAVDLSCEDPQEYDVGEYEACKKCPSCIARFTIDRLKKNGELPENI